MQLSLRPIKKRLRKTNLSDEASANCHFSRILRYKNLARTETPLNAAASKKMHVPCGSTYTFLIRKVSAALYFMGVFAKKLVQAARCYISQIQLLAAGKRIPCGSLLWSLADRAIFRPLPVFCKKPAEKRLVSGRRYADRSFKCSWLPSKTLFLYQTYP